MHRYQQQTLWVLSETQILGLGLKMQPTIMSVFHIKHFILRRHFKINYIICRRKKRHNKIHVFGTSQLTSSVLWVFAACKIVHNSAPSTPPELIVPSLDSLESQLSNDTRISSGGVDHPKLRFGFTKIENVTCDNFLVFGPKLGRRDMSNFLRRHFKINYIICRRNIERRGT